MAIDNDLSKDAHSSVNYHGLNHNSLRIPSLQYTKKWRIIIALLVGVCIIGVCILVFYLSAEAKKPHEGEATLTQKEKLALLSSDENLKKWRQMDQDECLTSLKGSCPKEFGDIPVFLLVLGGLRIDQVSEIPALHEYVRCGASAKSLVPSYPTFNYPNLYTIATGLYPESHGIVSYDMYDKEMNLNFTTGSPSSFNSGWWHGEPIWNTVGKNNKSSATYLWPGSNVQIQGRFPTFWQKDQMDFITRIKKVVDWIELPKEERPELIMMYYEEPVTTSLHFGPFSPRTNEKLATINIGLDELMTKLNETNLINCINIIIASEHGVAASTCDNSLYVEDFLDEKIPGRLFSGTVGRIAFNDDADKTAIERITKNLQCQKSGLRVLRKNEVPIRYHYTKGSRIGDLILDTRSGYRIATETDSKCLEGEFGYDNSLRSMQGVFIGHGPSFRVGYRTEAFRNVEIYNLLSHLVGVEPAPNNGTKGSLLHLLKKDLVKESDFEDEKETFLKENVKHLPVRQSNAVLGTFSEVQKTSPSCSCVHEEPTVAADVSELSSATSESTPSSATSTTTTTTTTTTTESTTTTTSSSTSTAPETSSSTSTSHSTSSSDEEHHSSTPMELENHASSISTTEPSTTTSNESVVAVHSHDERTAVSSESLLDQNSSRIDETPSESLSGGHMLDLSSSSEISQDELTTLAFISPVNLTTGSPSDVVSSSEHSISSVDNVQGTTPSPATTKETGPEARHVAEIIMAHENTHESEHNTTDEIVLEPLHRAESLVAHENEFQDIINGEDDFHYDHHHNDDLILSQGESQNTTESSVDDFVTDTIAQLDETHDHTHDTYEGLSNVTIDSEQLDENLHEKNLGNDTENIHENIAKKEISENHHNSEISEVGNQTPSEAQHSVAVEHPIIEEASQLIEDSEVVHTTEGLQGNLDIPEVTELSPVEQPHHHQIPEILHETKSEHEPLEEQIEHQDLTSEPHSHANDEIIHEEEIPVTEKDVSLTEDHPEEIITSTEKSIIERETSLFPEEESKLTEDGHAELKASLHEDLIHSDDTVSQAEASVAEPQREEIEILPIPEGLKSMSLVKDTRSSESKDEYRLQNFHCPWGFPRFSAPEVASDNLNILLHSSHIIGFPESLSLGVYTSFSLSKDLLTKLNKVRPSVPEGIYVKPEDKQNNMTVGCWISDSRLQRSSSDQCSRTIQSDLYKAKNVSFRQLFPEDLEFPDILNKEGYLLSNLAPVMKGFEEGPRNLMINTIKKWTKQKGPVNVVHGPVFDYDFDGRRDDITVVRNTIKPIIPSSYFYVVTICNETKDSEDSDSEESEETASESFNACPLSNLKVFSFVFPNTEDNDMCLMSDRDYLLYHLASLADVEDLTSLTFFPHMDHKSKVQIRAWQPTRLLSI